MNHPWRIAFGLTIAFAAVAVFLVGPRFAYLAPYSRAILVNYGFHITLYALAALVATMAVAAGALRSLGLYDVGRRVDLVERSIRRGDGDPELARRLRDEERGQFTEP